MRQREVRFPLPELNSFLNLDPSDPEIDSLHDCLESLRADPERGDPIPFAPYNEYPNCKVVECDRFLVVYTFNTETISVIEVLLRWEYE